MGIGKGKSDKIDIDGLIESSDSEGKISQLERSLTENIAELKQTTAVLNAAIDRMESIVSKFQTLKSLNNICMNFVVEVGRQLMAHRDKQLELQKKHEKRIACMLEKSKGVWLSDKWVRVLLVCFLLYNVLVILYVHIKV